MDYVKRYLCSSYLSSAGHNVVTKTIAEGVEILSGEGDYDVVFSIHAHKSTPLMDGNQ